MSQLLIIYIYNCLLCFRLKSITHYVHLRGGPGTTRSSQNKPGSCSVCYKSSITSSPMKRCTRCQAVYYCSPAHQKKHKTLCNYLATAADQWLAGRGDLGREGCCNSLMTILGEAFCILLRSVLTLLFQAH